MKVFQGASAIQQSFPKTVVTIGNFDGVHLGHRSIIEKVVKEAQALGGTSVVYTFRPHPQIALNPGKEIPLLLTYDEKIEVLESLGVQVVVEEPFGRGFSVTAPEQFFRDTLIRKLNARTIIVGYDFGLGKDRSGHLEVLKKLCEEDGVKLEVIQPLRTGNDVASSSRIRQLLQNQDLKTAARLLGRDFFYRGVVVKGDQRGRTIGFPTANIRPLQKLVLPYGVYATQTRIGKTIYPSVTNIGVRPTFQAADHELPALLETHLLDQSIDLYGTEIEVRFIQFLRGEKKFSGIDALKEQIQKDALEARQILGA